MQEDIQNENFLYMLMWAQGEGVGVDWTPLIASKGWVLTTLRMSKLFERETAKSDGCTIPSWLSRNLLCEDTKFLCKNALKVKLIQCNLQNYTPLYIIHLPILYNPRSDIRILHSSEPLYILHLRIFYIIHVEQEHSCANIPLELYTF